MLTKEQCVDIARNKCIEMFGKEFVEQNKADFSSTRCFNEEETTLEYSLLYAKNELYTGPLLRIGGNRPFEYYASVIVDMRTGKVRIDPNEEKTKLPA